ncbi:MAG: response regulator [Gemmatimonadetes bacterium]|nr:response regulator [Gemmatimonadota bacterium]
MATVLISDDEPVDRRHLEALLQSWGYTVLATTDGLEALEVWRAERPDLAIIDWLMPGMDGLSLCRTVRASPELGNPYIIILTARTATEDVVVGLGAGADDFLKKPFEQAELRARLAVGERVLELQQLGLVVGRGPSRKGARLTKGDLSLRHGGAGERELRQRSRGAHLLPGRAAVDAAAHGKPVGATLVAAPLPASQAIELGDQREEAMRGRVDVGRQSGDLVA